MALSTVYTFTGVTVGTTEYDLTSNSTTIQNRTTAGIYQLFLDCNAITSTERYRLRIYEKATSGSTQRVVQEVLLIGPQTAEPIYVTPALYLNEGWTFTLARLNTGGTDRAFSWSIRSVA
jgi:hypothetical protein